LYPTHPVPWLYVSEDRQESEAWDTIDALGISRSNIAMVPAFAPLRGVGYVLDAADSLKKDLIVWEGFGSYVGERAAGPAVKAWLSTMTQALRINPANGRPRPNPLTIIGIMEQPKMKPKDQYPNPRQRVSGPAVWGHSTSTIVLVEFANKFCSGPDRKLGIYPRNAPEIIRAATLATGHFVII
jgi:hypothetical protein